MVSGNILASAHGGVGYPSIFAISEHSKVLQIGVRVSLLEAFHGENFALQ